MEEFDNIFDEDIDLEGLEKTPAEIEPTLEEQSKGDDDFFGLSTKEDEPKGSLLDEFLKAKGISDNKITIIDENKEEKEVSFYDLTQEEQLEILNSQEATSNEDLDDSEIELINQLRANNMSIEDYLVQFRESVLAEVQQAEPSYDIDAYDDHELFLLDLKNKYDLTDTELQAELEKELANEELFTKKVTKLREEYKQLEDQIKLDEQAKLEADNEDNYNQFANTMVDIATNTTDFHGMFLEDTEKQETLSYLLEMDDTGLSRFSKDLNNPEKLYEAAWYLRYERKLLKHWKMLMKQR